MGIAPADGEEPGACKKNAGQAGRDNRLERRPVMRMCGRRNFGRRRRRLWSRIGLEQGLRRGGDEFDFGYKAVAAAADGFNVTRRLGAVVERFAKLAHGRVQPVFEVDEGVVWPKMLVELLAAHQLAVAFSKGKQQAAGLLLQAYGPAVPAQIPGVEIERKRPKAGLRPNG